MIFTRLGLFLLHVSYIYATEQCYKDSECGSGEICIGGRWKCEFLCSEDKQCTKPGERCLIVPWRASSKRYYCRELPMGKCYDEQMCDPGLKCKRNGPLSPTNLWGDCVEAPDEESEESVELPDGQCKRDDDCGPDEMCTFESLYDFNTRVCIKKYEKPIEKSDCKSDCDCDPGKLCKTYGDIKQCQTMPFDHKWCLDGDNCDLQKGYHCFGAKTCPDPPLGCIPELGYVLFFGGLLFHFYHSSFRMCMVLY